MAPVRPERNNNRNNPIVAGGGGRGAGRRGAANHNADVVPPAAAGAAAPGTPRTGGGGGGNPGGINNNVIAGAGSSSNWSSTTDYLSGSMEFFSTLPVETKEIVWHIKNFSTIRELKTQAEEDRDSQEIPFEAGHSVGVPSRWHFFVNSKRGTNDTVGGNEDKVGLYLVLDEYLGTKSMEKIFACFDACIKYPDGTRNLVNRTTSPTDMLGTEDWGWSAFISMLQLKEANAVPNDILTFHISFKIYGPSTVNVTSMEVTNKALDVDGKESVIRDLSQLLESANHSDFTIRVPKNLDDSRDEDVRMVDDDTKVEDETDKYELFKVHKNILSCRSPVFKAMIDSQLAESKAGSVTIYDLSPKSMKVVLKHLYCGAIDEEWALVCEEVVNAAEKYNLPDLMTFCDKKLHTCCNSDNAMELLKVAKLHKLPCAVKNIATWIKVHVDDVTSNV